jgi:DDE family transposase
VKRDDLLGLARLAVQIARTQMPDYANKFAPKRFTQPSLLACLCLKEFLHMDYRSCEALLASAQELRAVLGLYAVPDHSTLWWFSRHKVTPRLLTRVLTATVQLFQRAAVPRSRTVAVDSTGFARAPASPYYQQRAGQRHSARTWLKWSIAVWTDPLVLCGQVADRGPRGDHVEFRPLVAQTLARLRFTRLLADGGYDSEANHRWLREDLGIESIIPPVAGRPARGLARRPYRRQLQLAFPRKAYGQRWKVETFISVVKRRFGGAVTARRYWQQVKQTLLRGITYNLYRAVQWGLSGHLRSHRAFKAAA